MFYAQLKFPEKNSKGSVVRPKKNSIETCNLVQIILKFRALYRRKLTHPEFVIKPNDVTCILNFK